MKKRVKESTPPSSSRRFSPSNGQWQQAIQTHHIGKHLIAHNGEQQQNSVAKQQTITIRDTPSPAVSVITISDSEDETIGKW